MKASDKRFSKFTHITKHLKPSLHRLDPNLDLKHLVHHSTKQYVDRDADGDVDIYDDPKRKTPDENVMSAPEGARIYSDKLRKKQKGELKHTKRGVAYEEMKPKKDSCYRKVKSKYDVFPSAYAAGAIAKCRKKGASKWGVNEEKDHEHSMIRSQLSTVQNAVKRLKKKMKGEGNVEAWVQSKITKASDYLDSAADYVDSGEMNSESVEAGPILPKEKGKRVFPKGKEPKKTGAKLPIITKESTSIEDVNGNKYIEFIDIIKVDPLKEKNNIKESGKKCWKGYKKTGTQILYGKKYNRCAKKEEFVSLKLSDWRRELQEEKIKKSEMECNSPKSSPVGDSKTGKSHVVKACENGKEKIIRFGQRGVKGSPKKKGESKEYASRRHRFQSSHAKNIAKGKMSAAYWANKVKW